MDDIIQKIIDSEKKAQAVIKEAYEERRLHDDKLSGELSAYREKVLDDYNARTESFAAQQQHEAEIGTKHCEDAAHLKIVQLQQIAARNRNEWVSHLYQRILDGDIG
jgi:Skp family chaperone for outer membrane proteins